MRDLVQKPVITNLPRTGYYVSKEGNKDKIYKNESHIHKQGPLSGLNAGAHRLYNDILTYFPKGFTGSKNSDFYEYLSLGMVPYIIGSAMLIGLYGAANKNYNSQSAYCAGNVAKRMGAGVILYGIGKFLSKKISHKLIKGSTGVDLDMRYVNKVNELPENGSDKGITRVQYPGVFDSADFPRKDLIALDNELNYNNIYEYEDKIARKAGFKDKLNAPNQTMWPKIRELKVRTTALENISKYVMAATGVALGSQQAFEKIGKAKHANVKVPLLNGTKFKEMEGVGDFFANAKTVAGNFAHNVGSTFKNIGSDIKNVGSNIANVVKDTANIVINKDKLPFKQVMKNVGARFKEALSGDGIFSTVAKAFKQLWNGNERNAVTKNYGKALIIGSIATTLLTWLIPTINFKKNPNTMKSKVDGKKDYEVC